MGRTAVVAGSTGLVGECLLGKLLQHADYSRVIALSRKPLSIAHRKLEVVLSDMDDLGQLLPKLAADDAFCCLGTTQAKAGRVGLERVDYHMVVEFARATHKAGARQFLVVSSVGTSARAMSFYSRTKARMEEAVSEVGFESTVILRPSLLLGARGESRPLEHVAQQLAPLLSPFLLGDLKMYRPVTVETVADALVRLAGAGAKGLRIQHLPL